MQWGVPPLAVILGQRYLIRPFLGSTAACFIGKPFGHKGIPSLFMERVKLQHSDNIYEVESGHVPDSRNDR